MVRPVKLSTQCTDTEELHLHIRDRHSLKTKVYSMKANEQGQWEVDLDLAPGAYLYRFYRRKGSSLVYHSPDGGPHPMANAWDAAISVPLVMRSGPTQSTHITHDRYVDSRSSTGPGRMIG